MSARLHNFSAGPGVLPLSVLEAVKNELPVYRDTGASIMEISHRSAAYTAVAESAVTRLRRLLGLSEDWHVLFLQGGASLQFYQLPLNFLRAGGSAAYINTGEWSQKAIEQAAQLGNAVVAGTSEGSGFNHIPAVDSWTKVQDASYTHITTNNTIYGTQFQEDPVVGGALAADMSSDFLSRPVDVDKYSFIYAGAQKNLGPAGVTVVLVRDGFLKQRNANLPTMLDYGTHASKLYNTPPVFAVYVVEKVLAWIEEKGDLSAMAEHNRRKAAIIYDRIDASDFYRGVSVPADRSTMNITFRLASEDLEAAFVAKAKSEGLVSLKGHRSTGGIRASTYNACPMESARALGDFMAEFERTAG